MHRVKRLQIMDYAAWLKTISCFKRKNVFWQGYSGSFCKTRFFLGVWKHFVYTWHTCDAFDREQYITFQNGGEHSIWKMPSSLGAWTLSTPASLLPLFQVQCHTLTGYCWCVTPDGKPVSGSSVHNRTPVCSGTAYRTIAAIETLATCMCTDYTYALVQEIVSRLITSRFYRDWILPVSLSLYPPEAVCLCTGLSVCLLRCTALGP